MVPTMLHLLGQPFDPEGIDGRVLPEIARRLAPGSVVPAPGPSPGAPLPPGELARPRVPDYVGGPFPGGAGERGAEAELGRILALPLAARRSRLRNFVARPPYVHATATRTVARARELYLSEHASSWRREVARRSLANPPVAPGLVERDREEVQRIRHETWARLLAAIDAVELAPEPWSEVRLSRLQTARPAVEVAFRELLERIDSELAALAAWKDSTFLDGREKARRRDAYQALVARQPTVAEQTRRFLELAYQPQLEAEVGSPAGPQDPGFEGLGGPSR
jgi:hypothetical protein